MSYQGASDLHIKALKTFGVRYKCLKYPQDFTDDLTGLIMPGGESSAQYKYCMEHQIYDAIKAFAASNRPILGTCAGLILLSSYQSKLVQGLQLLDIKIERNTYGKQIASGAYLSDKGHQRHFIRAPGIIKMGQNIKVLDTYQGHPIFVKNSSSLSTFNNVHGTTFHPELGVLDQHNPLYQIFIKNNKRAS
ncbi:MAG: pyridoxal 5'-phosphate synthase glutaminase subunit PdxT [Candidatus Rhabdochlamydia sp.]